jgi:two-component system chemotaxis response regulator CheY
MKTLLIVDDSRTIRSIIKKYLRDTALDLREAANGQDAVEACQVAIPDFVLVDWNMPVMTGLGFVKELRRMPGGDASKVIFCTTETGPDHIAAALQAGADEYIMKPFDRDILIDKLAQTGAME